VIELRRVRRLQHRQELRGRCSGRASHGLRHERHAELLLRDDEVEVMARAVVPPRPPVSTVLRRCQRRPGERPGSRHRREADRRPAEDVPARVQRLLGLAGRGRRLDVGHRTPLPGRTGRTTPPAAACSPNGAARNGGVALLTTGRGAACRRRPAVPVGSRRNAQRVNVQVPVPQTGDVQISAPILAKLAASAPQPNVVALFGTGGYA
jgi:hypothetical protein